MNYDMVVKEMIKDWEWEKEKDERGIREVKKIEGIQWLLKNPKCRSWIYLANPFSNWETTKLHTDIKTGKSIISKS